MNNLDTFDVEKQFLSDQGWSFDAEDYPIDPTGKQYKEWFAAINAAVDVLLKKDDWFPVVVTTKHPRVKLKDSDFCYYSHHKHNRLFLWSDLVNCYVTKQDPSSVHSLIAKVYAESDSLKNLVYQKDMHLVVNMWTENQVAFYQLVEIKKFQKKN